MKMLLILFLSGSLSMALWAYQQPEVDVRGWEGWYKLNPHILESEAHNAMVDIYVNAKARRPYETEATSYPVGAIVVKPLYSDKKRGECVRIVVMVKMPRGYDPENGDWWYGVGPETAEEMYYQGRLRSCIACHKSVKQTDYMFSRSVMGKIRGTHEALATPLPEKGE